MSYPLTLKQETFCVEFIRCGNASEAYRAAYHTENMKPETINRNAHALLKNSKIAARLAALKAKVEERVVAARTHEIVSKERILGELWDTAMKAKAAEPVRDKDGTAVGVYQANWAASTKAIELYGKETHAMFVDRKEIRTGRIEELSDAELAEKARAAAAELGLELPDTLTPLH